MLAKSSKTPQGRLLSLFDILDDWLKAPHIENAAIIENTSNPLLISYCAEQAKAMGAENPEILAEHIALIARNAAQHALEQPDSNSLIHAKKAASALILAQTQNNGLVSTLRRQGPVQYGIAASLVLMISAASIWGGMLLHRQSARTQIAQNETAADSAATDAQQSEPLTAIDASRMYAKYEQMRQGTCQFPEALQIPDKDKAIYLENVVGGKLPTDLADLKVANFYLEKVRCNFTPMLMAASK